MTTLLDVRELSTVFHTHAGDVAAVNKVGYRLAEGESMAIVGESGCGKSVSALSLLRLVPAPGEIRAGEVLFRGVDLLELDEARLRDIRGRDIAMVFQDPATSLNPVLTIGMQMMEVLTRHRMIDKASARERAVETLTLVGIADARGRLDDYPHEFSGGQRQRIMIAMAILLQPALLIADEPTTALDVTIQAQIVELIESLRRRLGMAVIWISHDLALVAGLVDKVAVMYAGSIVEYGPAGDIFGKPRHPYTIGLLDSLPRFDAVREKRLRSIDGAPPDLAQLPRGCPFLPRCARAVERCGRDAPSLNGDGRHRVSCWEAD